MPKDSGVVKVTQTQYSGLLADEKKFAQQLEAAQWDRNQAREQGSQGDDEKARGTTEVERIQYQLAEVRGQISQARVISPPTTSGPLDVVGIGCRVKVRLNDGEEEKVFILGGALRGNLSQGIVSDKSPLGAALFGARKGDKRPFNTPRGRSTVEIIDITIA